MEDHKKLKEDLKLEERQKVIYNNLSKQNFTPKNLAGMYYGALKVLKDRSNPERYFQAAHSLRELGFYLTDHVEIDETTESTHRKKMKKFIEERDDLGGIDKDIIFKEWVALHGYFVDLCHHRLSKAPIEEFEKQLLNFENILLSIFAPFYDAIEELDVLIEKEDPCEDDLISVISIIKNQSQYRYIFRNLRNPRWLRLLYEGGFLDIPQKGEYCIETEYLYKVAKKKPKLTKKIVEEWSSTEHLGARLQLMKTIRELPIEDSLSFIQTIKKWISSSEDYFPALSDQVIKYIKELLLSDKIDKGFELTNSLFVIRTPDQNNSTLESEHHGWEQEHFAYSYDRNISQILNTLMKKGIIRTLNMFSKKLEVAIDMYLDNKQENNEFEDFSLFWRPKIEEPQKREDVFYLFLTLK